MLEAKLENSAESVSIEESSQGYLRWLPEGLLPSSHVKSLIWVSNNKANRIESSEMHTQIDK